MKEETRETISLVANTINSFALIFLGFFGYLVSSDVRAIQRESDQRTRAKQVQEFWNDMYTITQNSAEKSNTLGSAIGELLTTGIEAFTNYKRVYKPDEPDIQNIVKDDLKYNALITSFMGQCFGVLTKIDAIANEFDFLRLKYAVLAQEHQLEAWEKFFNQSEQTRAWKERIVTNTSTFCGALLDGIKSNTNPNELLRQMESASSPIGKDITYLSAPYLKGLSEFSAVNLENISKTVAK